MARSFPAYTSLQSFYTEQYNNEMYNRLRAFYAKQRGGGESKSAGPTIGYRGAHSGLPDINPGQYAREVLQREREAMAATIAEAKKSQSKEEMKQAPRGLQRKLYDGFSKEGKGRKAYLKERHEVIPEKKYAFPVLSSWKYGWQLDSATTLKKPEYARSRKIMDTFYTRNGIPDVYVDMAQRSHTTI